MADQPVAVSIIVPARNAERWAAHVVATLRQQTFARWEAIIVDDGSTDDTADAFGRAIGSDGRFRVIRQVGAGVSAARNVGIEAARHDWLLFLDADDRIAPTMLERVVTAIETTPEIELVRCGWASETASGETAAEHDLQLDELGHDLFTTCTNHCPTAPCAIVVRRSVVDEVGRFDTGLVVGEDWDLWQRIGRRGVVSEHIAETLAFYRLTPGSAMRRDFVRMCSDSRIVVERGHAPDPRVPRPMVAHADGAPPGELAPALDQLTLWTAAAAVGVGADCAQVLDSFPPMGAPRPGDAVAALYGSTPNAAGALHRQWPEIWPGIEPRIRGAADLMAKWAGDPASAVEIERRLESLIIAQTPVPDGDVLGRSQAVDVDLSRPPAAIDPLATTEQLVARVNHDGTPIGVLEIPIVGTGPVRTEEILAATAEELARPIFALAARHPGRTPGLARNLGWAGVVRTLTVVLHGAARSTLGRVRRRTPRRR